MSTQNARKNNVTNRTWLTAQKDVLKTGRRQRAAGAMGTKQAEAMCSEISGQHASKFNLN